MQGELKPNSHLNIKMTLLPGKYPCNFEGEIQCSIEWDNDSNANRHDDDHKQKNQKRHKKLYHRITYSVS